MGHLIPVINRCISYMSVQLQHQACMIIRISTQQIMKCAIQIALSCCLHLGLWQQVNSIVHDTDHVCHGVIQLPGDRLAIQEPPALNEWGRWRNVWCLRSA